MGNAQSPSFLTPIPTPDQLADELDYAMFLFWETLSELEPDEVETATLPGGWTPKALVAHLAFWDDFQRQRMEAALNGAAVNGWPRPTNDNDARAQADAHRPWPEVHAAAVTARQQLVDFARRVPPEALRREFPEGERTFSVLRQLQHMARHVREHRRELQAYCGSAARWGRDGLRRLMQEQHANLMDAIGGLTETTMLTTQVCGEWTIRDVLAHVLSWNDYCSRLLRQWPEPDPATVAEWQWLEGDSMAAMNKRLMAQRAHLNLIEIADGLTTEYRRILRVFDEMQEHDLTSIGMTWGGPGPLDCFFYEIFVHEAEHAAQIWAYRAGLTEQEAANNRSDDS